MTSDASSSVNLLDTVPLLSSSSSAHQSMASSPSACSVLSSDADRASPFAPASASALNASSPGSPYLRQIDFGASTSRSSLDSSSRLDYGEQLAQNVVQYRRRRRRDSSDSSGSDDGSVGAASHVSSIGGFSRSQDNEDEAAEGSRKTSMETPIRQADMPRGRLANIRRESSCTPSDEMAHERLTTAGIQVSSGWDDALRIGADDDAAATAAAATPVGSSSNSAAASPAAAAAAVTTAATAAGGAREEELHMRRRAPSASSAAALSELSILTHAWIPASCSPSPTRMSESTKQCYSPSTQKIVRPNIPYSPSPSPTASPTRKRLMSARSQSPIASRSALKRRVDCLPSSPVSSPMGMNGNGMLQLLQGASNGSGFSSASSSFSSSSSSSILLQPPPEKRPCPGGATTMTMAGGGGGSGYVRNSTSPLVIMDARAAAAASAAAVRRNSAFLVDPELRRASTESYSDVDPTTSGGANGNGDNSRDGGCDSISEPSSVLMPGSGDDAFDADALLFRAPSVPPPLSVGSNCSSRYETSAMDADETKSTIDGDEDKMDEEGGEDPNTSSSSSSLLDSTSKKEEDITPPECSDSDDISSQKEEEEALTAAAMEE